MVVVARSDVDIRTNDREDFAVPLLQGANCDLEYGNAFQGRTLAAWFLFLFFLFADARRVVARQLGILSMFFLRLRRLGCPMLHQGRIEDAGYPLRGLHFSAALLTKPQECLEPGSPCWPVSVCQRWEQRLWETERFLWREHVFENRRFATTFLAWASR